MRCQREIEMRVLVTFAMDAEFAPWRKLRSFNKLPRANLDLDGYSTEIDGAKVDVLLTGIGCKKAWVEATKILWDADVDLCISSGLGGGLKPEHRPGEVLAAESVFARETKTLISCSSELVEIAASCGAKIVKRFHSIDHVALGADEKRALGLRADVVEMESGEILYEAGAFGAKRIAVRAISDAVEENLPLDFNRATTESGDLSMARVLGQLARNPGSVPSVIRFGHQSRLAAENLAIFLDTYVQKLITAYAVPLAHGTGRA
jgi:adenosylhomocysteine nucleosidase